MKNLIKLNGLDEELVKIKDMESIQPELSTAFLVDRNYTHVIEILSGTAQAATTWREMPEGSEVTGIVTLKSGEAVLFLPGEPRLIRLDEGAEASEFVLR